jgi:site-specific DNA-methyltransferase (adenine-specific)
MSVETFLDGRVTLRAGDCFEVLEGLAETSVDAIVTDPPYHLTSIVRRFGAEGATAPKVNGTGAYARAARGFVGKIWDGGDVAFRPALWAKALRVLKPGGHLCAFGGTRTYHRLAAALEDGGFDIRDAIMWHYGSGFPKSHDISKAIDRAAGVAREKVRIPSSEVRNPKVRGAGGDRMEGGARPFIEAALASGGHELDSSVPATPDAATWSGWGTALKPATEIICLARKPLSEPTLAANVLRWGTGALNIGCTRIGTRTASTGEKIGQSIAMSGALYGRRAIGETTIGRWPANVVHDGSEEVHAAFPCAPGDPGSPARFFYHAKADVDDRLGALHPTVKPVDLLRWLARLITPPGGTILDPFSGTGTTGEAAYREGFTAILIEREAEYRADISRRMGLCRAGPLERAAARSLRRQGAPPAPLFADLTGGPGDPGAGLFVGEPDA